MEVKRHLFITLVFHFFIYYTLALTVSHTLQSKPPYIVSGGQTGRRLSTYFYAYTSSYNHLALLCAYVPIFSYYCMRACATAHAHTQLCFTRGAERVSSLQTERVQQLFGKKFEIPSAREANVFRSSSRQPRVAAR